MSARAPDISTEKGTYPIPDFHEGLERDIHSNNAAFFKLRGRAKLLSEREEWLKKGEPVQIIRGELSGQKAKIVFVGPTAFARGVWVGLVLDSNSGYTDGLVQGVRYFSCAKGYGTFVKPAVLKPVSAASPVCINVITPPSLQARRSDAQGMPESGEQLARPRTSMDQIRIPSTKARAKNSTLTRRVDRSFSVGKLIEQAKSLSQAIIADDDNSPLFYGDELVGSDEEFDPKLNDVEMELTLLAAVDLVKRREEGDLSDPETLLQSRIKPLANRHKRRTKSRPHRRRVSECTPIVRARGENTRRQVDAPDSVQAYMAQSHVHPRAKNRKQRLEQILKQRSSRKSRLTSIALPSSNARM